MKSLLIIASAISCVFSRPDIGLTLRQGAPTGSYLPVSSSSSSSYGTGNGGYGNGGDGIRFGQTGGFGSGGHSGGFGTGGSSGGFGNGGYASDTSSYQGISDYYGGGSAHVQKNVYFFDAPEDEPAPRINVRYQGGHARKSDNIIFVKAPSYSAPQVPQINLENHDEDKTRVYVLVKKQDEIQDIVIPTAGPSKASKPEVYYIRYKTQKDAEEQISNIQQGASSGISANAVHSDAQFVGTIRDSVSVTSGLHSGHDHSFSGLSSFGDGGGTGHGSSTVQTSHTASTGSENYGPAGASGPYFKK